MLGVPVFLNYCLHFFSCFGWITGITGIELDILLFEFPVFTELWIYMEQSIFVVKCVHEDMKMAVCSGIGVIFDVRLIGKDEPPILLKQVYFIGKWYGEGRQNFRVLPQKVFPVALLELFDKCSDIVINQSHNLRIWKNNSDYEIGLRDFIAPEVFFAILDGVF